MHLELSFMLNIYFSGLILLFLMDTFLLNKNDFEEPSEAVRKRLRDVKQSKKELEMFIPGVPGRLKR